MTIILILGPIASALSNKYGFRPVTMVGGFIATFFYFIATYSPNISWLIFLYGFCGGMCKIDQKYNAKLHKYSR